MDSTLETSTRITILTFKGGLKMITNIVNYKQKEDKERGTY